MKRFFKRQWLIFKDKWIKGHCRQLCCICKFRKQCDLDWLIDDLYYMK